MSAVLPASPALTLKPYLSVLSGRFQLMLQYRAAAFAGFITQCWFGVLRILIFAAFYAGGAAAAPMSLHNAVTYTWLGQGFLAFVPTGADPDVADMVRSGAVAYERLRPVDTYAWWYARALAWSVARVLPRAALLFTFAGFVIPLLGFGKWALGLPPTPAAAAFFLVSAVAMILLSAAITLAINVVLVTTLDDRGPSVLAGAFVYFFSGMVIPLAFFPDAIRPWLRAQPMAGVVDIPYSIYFGGIAGWGAVGAIALQVFWVAVLALLGRWGLERAMRKLQVQGGMINALTLYGRYCAASVRAQLAYPTSLAMMMTGQFLITGVEFIAIWAMFHRFGHVGQWSMGEVALFYGLVTTAFATSDMITRGFDIFGSVYVKGGGFDRLLLRPRSLALQVMGHELRLTRVGRYAQGFIVFGVGVWLTHFRFTPAACGILAFAIAGGTALFAGLLVLQATLSFWTVESLEAINIFTYGGEAAGEYPLNVYAPWFRNFLMWGVPIGCVTYLPMLAAMGRADPLGTPGWLGPIAPLAGFAFLGVALFIWRFGVSRYTSTGS